MEEIMKTQKQERDLAFDLLTELNQKLKAHHRSFFEIGRLLTELKEKELYKTLGQGGYDTWSQFMAGNELSVNSKTAEAYMNLYDFWVKQQNYTLDELSEVPYDKLRMVQPMARQLDSAGVRELFEKTKVLSRTDLLIETGKATEEGNLRRKWVNVELCDKCQGYKLPETLIVCTCPR